MNDDLSQLLQADVKEAVAKKHSLAIVGGRSKSFLQSAKSDAELNLSGHRGVLNYEPGELFITARSGTPLAEIEALLADHKQMLASEPPHFSHGTNQATLGGAIACGFSGSRRPFAGSLRDHVLGVKILNGEGELLQFGGQVMKNVAGFDVSRLMVGARGTLGALLEVSLKVMPKAEFEQTLQFECALANAPKRMSDFVRRSLPLTALAWFDGYIFVRLEGTETAINSAYAQIGGEITINSANLWLTLREQTHPFFRRDQALWRLSVPPASDLSIPENEVFIDWQGGLRWWHTDQPAEHVQAIANTQGGYAYLFRSATPVIGALPPEGLLKIHQRLKKSFDPHGIFNPGLIGGSL
ncbi:glycolate oxidase subunit GlcE [Methylobacter sp.]|uniref:glycolate oxidase subunit GlcE n=1 Tax=Methylobacter sp. TaxID=2051955 RepID=UPI002FDEAB96